ncbi:unnamed protein product [[Candida] boidinii]|nr:unnamed protein product [[Candida] boidinii]
MNNSSNNNNSLNNNSTQTVKLNLKNLSDVMVRAIVKRREINKIKSKSTYKPPPRVTLTEHKREIWLKNLSDINIPLKQLSRAVPHGLRNRVLLDQVTNHRVPISRTIWLIRCVSSNEQRQLKRKANNNSSNNNNNNNSNSNNSNNLSTKTWIIEWTDQTTLYLEHIIENCFSSTVNTSLNTNTNNATNNNNNNSNSSSSSSSHNQTWKSKLNYIIELIGNLYMEELLHRESFLNWLIKYYNKLIKKIEGNSIIEFKYLSVFLILIKLFWFKLIKFDYLSKELAELLLNSYSKLQDCQTKLNSSLKLSNSNTNNSSNSSPKKSNSSPSSNSASTPTPTSITPLSTLPSSSSTTGATATATINAATPTPLADTTTNINNKEKKFDKLFNSLKTSLQFLIKFLFYYNSNSFILTNNWNQLKLVLRKLIDIKNPLVDEQFKIISLRNKSLMIDDLSKNGQGQNKSIEIINNLDNYHQNSNNKIEKLVSLIFDDISHPKVINNNNGNNTSSFSGLLNSSIGHNDGSATSFSSSSTSSSGSSSLGINSTSSSSNISITDDTLTLKQVVNCLFNWAITNYRDNSLNKNNRINLVISIILLRTKQVSMKYKSRKSKQLKLELQNEILDFIDDFITKNHNDHSVNLINFLILINELYLVNLLNISSFLRRLIASGVIYLSNTSKSLCIIPMIILKSLPIINDSSFKNILKNLSLTTNIPIKLDSSTNHWNQLKKNCLDFISDLFKNKIKDHNNNDIKMTDDLFQDEVANNHFFESIDDIWVSTVDDYYDNDNDYDYYYNEEEIEIGRKIETSKFLLSRFESFFKQLDLNDDNNNNKLKLDSKNLIILFKIFNEKLNKLPQFLRLIFNNLNKIELINVNGLNSNNCFEFLIYSIIYNKSLLSSCINIPNTVVTGQQVVYTTYFDEICLNLLFYIKNKNQVISLNLLKLLTELNDNSIENTTNNSNNNSNNSSNKNNSNRSEVKSTFNQEFEKIYEFHIKQNLMNKRKPLNFHSI